MQAASLTQVFNFAKEIHMKSIMLLAAAAALSVATTARADALPPAVHAGSASYVSGGIGKTEADAMRQARSEFPLMLMMSQG